MTACKCDVCGKLFEINKANYEVKSFTLSNHNLTDRDRNNYKHFDLCDDCFDSLTEWMKERHDKNKLNQNYEERK